jgi:hypothetical protein
MVAAMDRIVVQLTPVQKRAIVSTAKRLGLNVSELMCQAGSAGHQSDNEENINALISRVNASVKDATDRLDDALSFVAKSNKRIAAMTGGR